MEEVERAKEETERAEFAGTLVTLLTRALHLERAVLLVEETPDGTLVAVARHGAGQIERLQPGEPPGDGPWSAAIPLRSGAGTGLLLVARAGGAPLAPRDLALAQRLAEGAARLAEHGRMAADLARSRELLARADRLSALGMLAAGVAHEIRNPLVSVRTFIQLLPERMSDEEFRTRFRDLALAEIERICGLINDLLAFSRPAPAHLDATDLNDLVSSIVRLLDAESRKNGTTVIYTEHPALPRVVVDQAQIKQVLMNVVLNAIEASERRGPVEVRTRQERRGPEVWCVVEVADAGTGIQPEHREHIFDPFFTTKDRGSGLGLFIAQGIVTQHGGYMRTAARGTGGTLFSIHLPARGRPRDVDAH